MRHWSCLLLMVGCLGVGAVQVQAQPQSPAKLVRVDEVRVVGSDAGLVVLLTAREHVIPIFVDPTVAWSIQGALTGKKSPRPLSHDLMHTILRAYGVTVVHVQISLKGQVFYGELHLSVDGQTQAFDSRSSDGIALAIHFGAPIFVEEALLKKAGEEVGAEDSQTIL